MADTRPDDQRRAVDMLASDLFLASTCRGIAAGYGATFRQHLSAKTLGESLGVVVCDLQKPGLDPAEIRRVTDGRTLLGFAPHVKTDLISAARAAGFDVVVPRSKLQAELERLLAAAAG